MNIVVLLAGGSGSRMKATLPKQHILIENHEIIEYTLTAFSRCELVDSIMIVSNPHYISKVEKLRDRYKKLRWIIEGGATRIDSVKNAVVALMSVCTSKDKIIVSDAVRPCVSVKETEEILSSLNTYPAVTTGVEVYETVMKFQNGKLERIIPRDGIVRQTTPEGYLFATLHDLYICEKDEVISQYSNIGIDRLFSEGISVGYVKSSPLNFKITTEEDLYLFEYVLKQGFEKIVNRSDDYVTF